jgi:hypothetical protein
VKAATEEKPAEKATEKKPEEKAAESLADKKEEKPEKKEVSGVIGTLPKDDEKSKASLVQEHAKEAAENDVVLGSNANEIP